MCSNFESSPTEGLSEFFHTIWGDTNGFVYLPTLDRKSSQWKKVFFEWPAHEANIVQHVLTSTAKGLDSYYSPAIYKSPTALPNKENFLGTSVLWAEFDGDAPRNWGEPTHADGGPQSDRAGDGQPDPLAGTSAGIPAPSVRVQSSNDGHEHVYWKLDTFCTDIKWVEDKNRSITYSMRSDTSGWDAVQILRPPYTTNYKRDRPVTVMVNYNGSYSADRFSGLKAPEIIVGENIIIEELPAVEGLIAKYKWDDEHFKLFMDPSIEEGSRSSALMRLGYFCIETGMSDTEAYTIIDNADNRWGKYVGRADRKRRLVDIINRARQKHPHAMAETTFGGLLSQDKSAVTAGGSLTYGFQDFLDSEIVIEWAIEGLLEKGGFGMVAAMPGVGKTQLSIQLAIASALGKDFLKWKIPKAQKTVLLSLEMSHVGLKIFMSTIAQQYTPEEHALLQENLIIIPLGEPIALDRPEGMQFLEIVLDKIQPDGIVIDSLGKLSLDELGEKTVRTINNQFLHLRSRYNSFLWIIHHNRKASDGNKTPNQQSDVYGNVYITAEMSSVIILWPETDGSINCIPVKSRYSEMRKPFKLTRNSNLFFDLTSDLVNVGSGLAGEANNESGNETTVTDKGTNGKASFKF